MEEINWRRSWDRVRMIENNSEMDSMYAYLVDLILDWDYLPIIYYLVHDVLFFRSHFSQFILSYKFNKIYYQFVEFLNLLQHKIHFHINFIYL